MIKTGHVTPRILDRLSNLCLTKTSPIYPANDFTTDFIEVKGDTRMSPPSRTVEQTCTAGPDPMDLPRSLQPTNHNYVLWLIVQRVSQMVDCTFYVGKDGFLATWGRFVESVAWVFQTQNIDLFSS